jgi:hypothetical protein
LKGHFFTDCGKLIAERLLWQGMTLQATEKLAGHCFVTGHDFSRVSMSLRLTQVHENAVECGMTVKPPSQGCGGTGGIEAVVVSDLERVHEPINERFQAFF